MQKTSQKDAFTFVVILKWDGRTQFYRQMIPVFTAFDAIFSPGFFISSFLYANAASPSLCCRGLLSLINREENEVQKERARPGHCLSEGNAQSHQSEAEQCLSEPASCLSVFREKRKHLLCICSY